jgi:hypothetical protein
MLAPGKNRQKGKRVTDGGIEPALLILECISVTCQTQKGTDWVDAQHATPLF